VRRLPAALLVGAAAFAGCSRTSLLTFGASTGGSGAAVPTGGAVATGGTFDAGGSAPAGGRGGGEGATGGFAASGGEDAAAGSGGAKDAGPDAGWDPVHSPWAQCVNHCYQADNYNGYLVMRALIDSCACKNLCARYCVTDAGSGCIGDVAYPPPQFLDCSFCEVATAMMGVCGGSVEFQLSAKPFYHCLQGCGAPPAGSPLPEGSLDCPAAGTPACPNYGGGEPDGGDCCPAQPPAEGTACPNGLVDCVYGTTACQCGYKQSCAWSCFGYDPTPAPL
jgi:hypothetical protein